MQATGRDARGRKQYRYHAQYRERQEEAKFELLVPFGRALPTLRRQVDRDLARPGLPRERVVALVIELLERTLVRVGNEEYARTNRSYGLTTLRTRHVEIGRAAVRFAFRGKSGVEHQVTVEDRRVARALQRCAELPGQELFQYLDEDGARHA